MLCAMALTVALFYYNNDVLPDANHRLKTLTADIHKMHPTIAIKEGVFIDDFEGYHLLVREVGEDGVSLHDVTIYILDPRQPTRTVHAPRGELMYSDDGNELIIRLYDGEIHEVDKEDESSYFLLDFQTHDIIFDDLGTKLERRFETGARGDRELSAAHMRELTRALEAELAQEADSMAASTEAALEGLRGGIHSLLQSESSETNHPSDFVSRARILLRSVRNAESRMERQQRHINRYLVEIHKKYAFPFACIVFVLLGAPLGARVRRGGLGVGGGLSFVFFLLYYMASLGGEKLGDRGLIPPALGMWGINIALGAAGLALVLRRDARFPFRRVGLR
jgi:lipopolysaccharide export system permease protein